VADYYAPYPGIGWRQIQHALRHGQGLAHV